MHINFFHSNTKNPSDGTFVASPTRHTWFEPTTGRLRLENRTTRSASLISWHEPVLTCCQLDTKEQNKVKYRIKFKPCYQRKNISICRTLIFVRHQLSMPKANAVLAFSERIRISFTHGNVTVNMDFSQCRENVIVWKRFRITDPLWVEHDHYFSRLKLVASAQVFSE